MAAAKVDLSRYKHLAVADQLRIQNQYEDDAFQGTWMPVHMADDAICMSFSPCGRYLAIGTRAGRINVYGMLVYYTLSTTLQCPAITSGSASSENAASIAVNQAVHSIGWSSTSKLLFASYVLDWPTGTLVQVPDQLAIPPESVRTGIRLLRGQAFRCDAWWNPVGGHGSEVVSVSNRGEVARYKIGLVEQVCAPQHVATVSKETRMEHMFTVVRMGYYRLPGRPAAACPEMHVSPQGWAYISLKEPSTVKGIFMLDLHSFSSSSSSASSSVSSVVTEGPYREPVESTFLVSPCTDGHDTSLMFASTKVVQGKYRGHVIAFKRGTRTNAGIGELYPRKGPAGGDVERICKHPFRGLLVALTSRGSVYSLSQPLETAAPGPAYPPGFQLCIVNRPYNESENEFDLVAVRHGPSTTAGGTGTGAGGDGLYTREGGSGGQGMQWDRLTTQADSREFRFRRVPEPDDPRPIRLRPQATAHGRTGGTSTTVMDHFQQYKTVAEALVLAVREYLARAKEELASAESAENGAVGEENGAVGEEAKAVCRRRVEAGKQGMAAVESISANKVAQVCSLVSRASGALAGVPGRPLSSILPPDAPGAQAEGVPSSEAQDVPSGEGDGGAQQEEEEEGQGAATGTGERGRAGRAPAIPGLAYINSSHPWATGLPCHEPLRAVGHTHKAAFAPISSTLAQADRQLMAALPAYKPSAPGALTMHALFGAPAGAVQSGASDDAAPAPALLLHEDWMAVFGLTRKSGRGDAGGQLALSAATSSAGNSTPAASSSSGTAASWSPPKGLPSLLAPSPALACIHPAMQPQAPSHVALGAEYIAQLEAYAAQLQEAVLPAGGAGGRGGTQGSAVGKGTGVGTRPGTQGTSAQLGTALAGPYPILPSWDRCAVVLEDIAWHNSMVDDRARRVRAEQQRISLAGGAGHAQGAGKASGDKAEGKLGVGGKPRGKYSKEAGSVSAAGHAGPAGPDNSLGASLDEVAAAHEAFKARRREQYRLKKLADAQAAGEQGSPAQGKDTAQQASAASKGAGRSKGAVEKKATAANSVPATSVVPQTVVLQDTEIEEWAV